MLSRTIRRRDIGASPALPGDLHPLLRRLYANRGVSEPTDLDLGLARLIPVSQLGGINAAVDLLCEHYRRGSRIVVVGDFAELRAHLLEAVEHPLEAGLVARVPARGHTLARPALVDGPLRAGRSPTGATRASPS